MKRLPEDELGARLAPYLERAGLDPAAGPAPGAVGAAAARPRRDARRDGRCGALFLRDAASGVRSDRRARRRRATAPALTRSLARVRDVDWTREAIGAAIKAAAARHGLKPPQVMMAMRVLVCGTRETPAIDAVLALLGRERRRVARTERGSRAAPISTQRGSRRRRSATWRVRAASARFAGAAVVPVE